MGRRLLACITDSVVQSIEIDCGATRSSNTDKPTEGVVRTSGDTQELQMLAKHGAAISDSLVESMQFESLRILLSKDNDLRAAFHLAVFTEKVINKRLAGMTTESIQKASLNEFIDRDRILQSVNQLVEIGVLETTIHDQSRWRISEFGHRFCANVFRFN